MGVLRSYTLESTHNGCDQGIYKVCVCGAVCQRSKVRRSRWCSGLLPRPSERGLVFIHSHSSWTSYSKSEQQKVMFFQMEKKAPPTWSTGGAVPTRTPERRAPRCLESGLDFFSRHEHMAGEPRTNKQQRGQYSGVCVCESVSVCVCEHECECVCVCVYVCVCVCVCMCVCVCVCVWVCIFYL